IEEKLASGIPWGIRQNVPREGTTKFEDEIYGTIEAPNEELDDMILIKSDGFPTYNFANVVDDHLMGITHVVRGNEYLSSAPKYNRLYEAFGWEVPVYVHCPLITDAEHKKLSKRSGHSSFEDLLEQGFVSEAIINYVALLGWCPEDNREIFSLQELVEAFDYRHMSKSPAVFDIQKLRWMNGEYLKAMDFDTFYESALPYLKQAITRDLDLRRIAAMVKTRIEIYPDILEMVDFFEKMPEYDRSLFKNKKSKSTETTSLEVLEDLIPLLTAQEDFSNDALFTLLKSYVDEKGCKVNFVMWPLRVAVSGKTMTPAGATEIMDILGKEESLIRIQAAIEKLRS
ncbi:MAG: glutamate--tRNA ligase, partial [Lachnospiraceae bacterium]|nr:glutamate--tRNA ligase [Lachnospiraceae bacterium]